jgi:hypothetical protein
MHYHLPQVSTNDNHQHGSNAPMWLTVPQKGPMFASCVTYMHTTTGQPSLPEINCCPATCY